MTGIRDSTQCVMENPVGKSNSLLPRHCCKRSLNYIACVFALGVECFIYIKHSFASLAECMLRILC